MPLFRVIENGWVAFTQPHDIEADSLEEAIRRLDSEHDGPCRAEPIWDVRHTSYYEDYRQETLNVAKVWTVVVVCKGVHESTRLFTDFNAASNYMQEVRDEPQCTTATITSQHILTPKVNHAHPDAS
tara:strand:- start:100 stop:480 length:381 start_codon:yes stop_codon:yes gene_type:complete